MGTFMSKFSQASSRFNKTGETNLHNNGPVDPNKDKKSGDNPNINIDSKSGRAVSIRTKSGGNFTPTQGLIDDAVAGTGPTFNPERLQMDKSYVTKFGGGKVELKDINPNTKYSKFVDNKGKSHNLPQTRTGQNRYTDSVSTRQKLYNKQIQGTIDFKKNLEDYNLAGGKGTKKVRL